MPARIAITGMSAEKYSSPGIHVARCIKEERPDISLVAIGEPLMPGMYMSKILDASYFVQSGDIDKILKICEDNNIDAIIPNTDRDVEICAENIALLESRKIKLIIPSLHAVQIANDKIKTSMFAASIGFISPKTFESTPETRDKISLPYMVKGKRSGVLLARTKEEGAVADQYIRQMGENPIIQEFIEGEPYSIAGIAVGGKIRAAVSMKKLNITESGSTLSGVTTYDDELNMIAGKMMSELNWNGPFEIEFIKNSQYHMIEINCRFPAWIYLSKGAGLNLPAMLVEMLIGEDGNGDVRGYKTGVAFMRLANDMILDIKDIVGLEMRGKVEW